MPDLLDDVWYPETGGRDGQTFPAARGRQLFEAIAYSFNDACEFLTRHGPVRNRAYQHHHFELGQFSSSMFLVSSDSLQAPPVTCVKFSPLSCQGKVMQR